jgi:hypothetical protein
VRASAVRVFVKASKLALTSAEHSNSGACLGISQTLYYKNILTQLSTRTPSDPLEREVDFWNTQRNPQKK